MGTYGMHAEPVAISCLIQYGVGPDLKPSFEAAAFNFDLTLSRQSDAAGAYLTIAGCERSASNCVRDASWDGQVLASTASSVRQFPTCAERCVTTLTETITLSLLSSSQASAVSLGCPADPLSGGTPAPDPDAGITAPGITGGTFDALLACGELHTTLEATNLDGGPSDGGEDGGCPLECLGCTTSFTLSGLRK